MIPSAAMSGQLDGSNSLELENDVSMAGLTTLAVGGPARYVATCRDTAGIHAALDFARRERLPVFLLGGGSNLLVSDGGFDGLVLRISDSSLHLNKDGADHVEVSVGAGARWDPFVARCVHEGLAGIECLSGIPGLAGAAPIQNIGAYGQEVSESVLAVDVLDLKSGRTQRLASEQCQFGYRTSRFKAVRERRGQPGYAVLKVHLRLRRKDEGAVRYPDLERRLRTTKSPAAPPLAEVRRVVLEIRREKSMVIDPELADPGDPNRRSAGSFFVNPVVDADAATAVLQRAQELDAGDPHRWPMADGRTKFSAAWLIEASGFGKGYRKGRAAISTRHALALVNLGGAQAAELMALAEEIRSGVSSSFGVRLTPEPVLLGFS
ncbi:MAG: UDP-N-acetylmuramate dehydrogenase [Thermoanaerobaculia bacterium]|nr:UDP-N-acetylmuramate dehydrogenase [Thermoanaerobaculia bacterium]